MEITNVFINAGRNLAENVGITKLVGREESSIAFENTTNKGIVQSAAENLLVNTGVQTLYDLYIRTQLKVEELARK